MKRHSKATLNSVQDKSKKISKEPKPNEIDILNFCCGSCVKGFKSYAALYLHIRRTHNGVKPAGTVINTPARPKLDTDIIPGRPSKPEKDIDELEEREAYLEIAQNSLINFMGEKLSVLGLYRRKLTLETVEKKIIGSCQAKTDKWTTTLLEEAKNLISEYNAKDRKMQHLDFDEDFVNLDAGRSLRIIVWFLVWLAQICVNTEFIPELCIIFSNIWRVLDETKLETQELDNKLVWKKIGKYFEGLMSSLPTFKNDIHLLNEFIQKVCHLIGKIFDKEEQFAHT